MQFNIALMYGTDGLVLGPSPGKNRKYPENLRSIRCIGYLCRVFFQGNM